MCGQQAETTQHKIDKDKSQREKEQLQAQVLKLKNDLDEKNNDVELANKRIERLETEITDYISRDDGKHDIKTLKQLWKTAWKNNKNYIRNMCFLFMKWLIKN